MSLQARDARATRQAAPSHVAPQKLFFLVLSRPILPFTLDVESYRSRLPRLYSLRVFPLSHPSLVLSTYISRSYTICKYEDSRRETGEKRWGRRKRGFRHTQH